MAEDNGDRRTGKIISLQKQYTTPSHLCGLKWETQQIIGPHSSH